MSITKIATTDYIVAQGHPSLADIKNRAARELHTKMTHRHDADGVHDGLTSLCYGVAYHFTGDGTSPRTISLGGLDPYLIPKFLIVCEMPQVKDTEFVTNGGFDSGTTGWAIATSGDSIVSVAGGVSGNCCQVTQAGTQDAIMTQTLTVTIGRRYRLDFAGKQGTSGALDVVVAVSDATLSDATSRTLSLGATWAALSDGIGSAYFIPTVAAPTLSITVYMGTAGTSLIDNVKIWEDYAYFPLACRTDTMDDEYYRETLSMMPTAPLIDALDTAGEFTLNCNDEGGGINTNGVENYYIIWGTHAPGTYTGSGGGTDPNWVEDGQQMLGGTVGTEPGNRVEKHIDDAILVEHDTDGNHTTNPFAGYLQIETGSYVGTGNTQIHTLANGEMVIRELILFGVEAPFGFTYTTTDTLDAGDVKTEKTAAFTTALSISIGTGTFNAGGQLGRPYHWVAFGD